MAKGLRSSTRKANRAKLRCKVFGPVEDARTQRLSAKLLKLASRPRPKAQKDVRVEETDNMSTSWQEGPSNVRARTSMSEQEKGIDHPATSMLIRHASRSRMQKRRSGKARASVVFPGFGKSKRLGSKKLLQR